MPIQQKIEKNVINSPEYFLRINSIYFKIIFHLKLVSKKLVFSKKKS
jgi:hypothetical protein